jgi:hypothetical protein
MEPEGSLPSSHYLFKLELNKISMAFLAHSKISLQCRLSEMYIIWHHIYLAGKASEKEIGAS